VETGTGRTTLLLSNRGRHTTFCMDDEGEGYGHSLKAVRASPLLGPCEFAVGVTQKTVPAYAFEPLDFALIDGPHGFPFPDLEYYYIYPHLKPGAVLVIDDLQIPTIRRLWDFVRDDAMFQPIRVVSNAGFLRRTDAGTFDPTGDGWWLQKHNTRRRNAIAARLRLRLDRLFGY
jgi:hypothetical protein